MWTDPGWFIYQLEVRIWIWSSASWPKNFSYLSFSTLYSSSLWRTDTIVFSELDKLPISIKLPPQNGLEKISPPGGLNRGFMVNYQWKLASQLMSLPLSPTQSLKGLVNCCWRLNLFLLFIISSQPKQEAVLTEVLMVKSDITYGEIAIQFSRLWLCLWHVVRHYPDLVYASDWMRQNFQPIRSTTQIWVVTCHQYGISTLIPQTYFVANQW